MSVGAAMYKPSYSAQYAIKAMYDIAGNSKTYYKTEIDAGINVADGYIYTNRYSTSCYSVGYNAGPSTDMNVFRQRGRLAEATYYYTAKNISKLTELRTRYNDAGNTELVTRLDTYISEVNRALSSASRPAASPTTPAASTGSAPTPRPATGPTPAETTTATTTATTYNNVPAFVQQSATTTINNSATISGSDVPPDVVIVEYVDDADFVSTPITKDFPSLLLTFNITPHSSKKLIPGSVIFSIDGNTYYDRNGRVVSDFDPETGSAVDKGSINYETGVVILEVFDAISDPTVSIQGGLLRFASNPPSTYIFRAPSAPLLVGSFNVRGSMLDGSQISALANNQDKIVFDGSGYIPSMRGTINSTTGIVRLDIGRWREALGNETESWYNPEAVTDSGIIWEPIGLMPETAMYNCVGIRTLPLDSSLIGLDPIRLPSDGRVPIFKSGDVVVLHHTSSESIGSGPFTNAQEITLSRGVLSIVDLYDYLGNLIPDDGSVYTVNLNTGIITVVSGTLMNGYTNGNVENVVVNHRIEDMLLLSEAQINGLLTTVGPVVHDYPATGAQVSTALIFGDLAARVVRLFYESTWDGIWRDNRNGSSTTSKYDTLNFPFIVKNKGCADQRWALKFTSSSTVDVIGETLGEILADANVANEIAPINPATGTSYFTILNTGWGTGWSTGNVIRFDTTSANAPVWLVRTTMQGSEEEPTDNFVMQIRGDAN